MPCKLNKNALIPQIRDFAAPCALRPAPCLILCLSLTLLPLPALAWVGLEINAGATSIVEPYAVEGQEGSGSHQSLNARLMLQEGYEPWSFEGHLLATMARGTGRLALSDAPAQSPFRAWDLEAVHWTGDSMVIRSELDRLSLTLDAGVSRMTLGRQAVTWGEAYYYNIGDVFGAFPITETNRLHKAGIDAVTMTTALGTFSDLTMSAVPSGSPLDGAALRYTLPVGKGSLSLTAARLADEDIGGAGCTLDLRGTKFYFTWMVTRPALEDGFQEAVGGIERQVGPYTHLVAEVYRNGWGGSDPRDYPSLLASPRFYAGRALTLGRWNAALAVNRQLTPLWTGNAALFANLSDGSCLVRMDTSRSLSDLSDLRLGVSAGVGERPSELSAGSEFGTAPLTFFAEAVSSF